MRSATRAEAIDKTGLREETFPFHGPFPIEQVFARVKVLTGGEYE